MPHFTTIYEVAQALVVPVQELRQAAVLCGAEHATPYPDESFDREQLGVLLRCLDRLGHDATATFFGGSPVTNRAEGVAPGSDSYQPALSASAPTQHPIAVGELGSLEPYLVASADEIAQQLRRDVKDVADAVARLGVRPTETGSFSDSSVRAILAVLGVSVQTYLSPAPNTKEEMATLARRLSALASRN